MLLLARFSYFVVLIMSLLLYSEIKNYNITKIFLTHMCHKGASITYQTILKSIYSKKRTLIFSKMTQLLSTIPVELMYRIVDHLQEVTIIFSCRNICTRLYAIIDTYYRYQVIFAFFFIKITFSTSKYSTAIAG